MYDVIVPSIVNSQGSVLSPSLCLMVMDPLLRQLEESGVGLSINNFYMGGFLHVDDIRTLAILKCKIAGSSGESGQKLCCEALS